MPTKNGPVDSRAKVEIDHLAPNIRNYINEQIRKVIEAERHEKELKQKQHLMNKPSLPLPTIFTLHDNQRLVDENTVGLSPNCSFLADTLLLTNLLTPFKCACFANSCPKEKGR